MTGYNSAHSLQNYVYFTKGTGFHDISINNGWDVSKVTSMAATFYNATNFNQSLDSWDVSSVTSIYWMFRGAENFNQDLNSWTTSGLYNTTFMFNGAYKFNGAIGNWDTSNVTDMREMFNGAEDFNQDLNSWTTSSVTTMTRMFQHAFKFNGAIGNWDTSEVKDMNNMFTAWTDSGSSGVFNQDIGGWDVSKVTSMYDMFPNQFNFDQDLNSWNVSSVTNMWAVFLGCKNFNQPLNNWNISSVNKTENMFHSAEKFNQDISGWDMSNVTDMGGMFYHTLAFNQDISGWDVSKVTDFVDYGLSSGHSDSNFTSSNPNYFAKLLKRDLNIGTQYNWDSTTYTLTGTGGGEWHDTNYSFQTISNEYKNVSFKVLTPGGRLWSVGLSSYPLSNDGYTLNNSNSVDANAYLYKEFYQFHVNGIYSYTAESPYSSTDITYLNIGSVDLFDDKHLSIITVPSENKVYFYIDAVKVQEYTTTHTGDWYICAQMDSDTTLQFTNSIIFNITSPTSVTKDGESVAVADESEWKSIVIKSFYPSNSDFFNKEYTIEWEDDPMGNNHGGYYLTFNGLTAMEMHTNGYTTNSSMHLRKGGPTWWLYTTPYDELSKANVRPYQDGEKLLDYFSDEAEWAAFRKKNTMTFKFVDDTNWEVSWLVGGSKRSYIIPNTEVDNSPFNFSEKNSIELRYKTWYHHYCDTT